MDYEGDTELADGAGNANGVGLEVLVVGDGEFEVGGVGTAMEGELGVHLKTFDELVERLGREDVSG